MRYFRQALALMREEKLYSAMYIAGTALAVAFVMLIAEVYYVKVADIAPESRRSTTYYLDFLPLKSDPNEGAPLNHEVFTSLFQKMKTPECVTGAVVMFTGQPPYMKMADGLHDRAVTRKAVEPGYFRFYEYRFVQGAPFTQDDFDNGRSVAVITDEVSDLLFGRGADAVGKTISVNNFDYRVCGVVEAPSALMGESVADIWMPYTAKSASSGWEVNWQEAPIDVTFSVPADRREAFMQELKEVEARYNSVHKGQEADMTAHLKSHYSKVWESIADVFDAWDRDLFWYVAPAILLLLLVPALNLSGMVASRMERQLPEMAIRKAFGAKRRTLLGQVIMENLVLTLIGGVIGLCLAWTALYAWRDWVFYVFSDSSSLYGSVPIVRGEMLFGPAVFAIALLVCCVLNVLAATVPAWLSLRRPIVESTPLLPAGGVGRTGRTSVWLALELILVTLACWWAFDPVLVAHTVTRLPMGYDADRLVMFQVASTKPLNWQIEELGTVPEEEEVLLQKVRAMDEVAEAYPARSVPIGFHSVSGNTYFFNEGDSLLAWQYRFMPDSKMFEVYGIQSITPDVPTSLLTHDCEYQRSIILTRSMAMGLFGTTDVAGRTVFGARHEWVSDDDGYNGRMEWVRRAYHIRAVVEDVRIEPYDRDYAIAFLCEGGPDYNVPIIARLRDDVSGDWFVEARRQEVQRDLVTEHCYVRDMQTARQSQKATIEGTGVGRQMRRNVLIAAFFAVNLAFGVFGTLMMYTRQRREEAGVRRAFGATRWSIFRGFIREAWLLTTVSVVVGCIIYFQFATARGLYDVFTSSNPAVHLWFDDFGTHFLVVSAVVYIIIMCAVLIATAIPAWRICRSEITEALKDE